MDSLTFSPACTLLQTGSKARLSSFSAVNVASLSLRPLPAALRSSVGPLRAAAPSSTFFPARQLDRCPSVSVRASRTSSSESVSAEAVEVVGTNPAQESDFSGSSKEEGELSLVTAREEVSFSLSPVSPAFPPGFSTWCREAAAKLPLLPAAAASAFRRLVASLQQPAVVAVLAAAVLLAAANPEAASAASGGGRIGGSSFSSSRSRSYSPPPSSGYSGGGGYSGGYSPGARVYSAPPVYSAPFFAPSPFYGGWGFGPSMAVGFGGGGGFFSLLVLGMIVALAINMFVGQSEADTWEDTSTVSVLRVQVGLLGLARGIQKDLDRIAETADTSTPEGLHYILQETVLSLMRKPEYCVYGYSSNDITNDTYVAEQSFNSLSMEERSKFSDETLVNVGSVRNSKSRPPSKERFNSEYIVVTLLVATEGKLSLPDIKDISGLRQALGMLGSVTVDQLQAVEILWTPQNDEDTLSSNEVLHDYPKLRSLV